MPKHMKPSEPYEIGLFEALRDPKEATLYLNAAMEDPDPRIFLIALKEVARARGGMTRLSRQARLNREHLYRMLSRRGNPSLSALGALLAAMGLRLSITPC